MSEDIRQKISDFNERLRVLDRSFKRYFSGLDKRAPIREFEQFKRDVNLLRKTQSSIMSVSLRFLINNFQQRFTVYRTKWEKILNDIEKGRVEPGSHFNTH